jgi:MFS family permease
VLFGSLSAFTLIAGFAATGPYMQARRDELGCDAPCIGSMTSASSLLRLVGAMVVGRLSDTMGRRAMLWLGVLGCGLSLLIAATIDSLVGMWLSAIPASLLNHNASVLKALFADYASEGGLADVEVASAMGKLGMAIGASFMLGPALASLTASSYHDALLLAAGSVCLSALCVAALPAVKPTKPTTIGAGGISALAPGSTAPAPGGSALAHVRQQLVHFFSLPVLQTGGARLIVAIRLFAGLAFNVYQVVWSVSLKARFDFGPRDYGVFMGIVGFSYALSQGFVARALIRRARGEASGRNGGSVAGGGEGSRAGSLLCNLPPGPHRSSLLPPLPPRPPPLLRPLPPLLSLCPSASAAGNTGPLALACICCLGLGRPIALWVQSLTAVYAMMVVMVMALGVLNTLISSACASLATGDELGGLFGMLDAVENSSGIVGPLLGGQLARFGSGVPLAVVVGCYVANFVLIALFYHRHVILAHPVGARVEAEAAGAEQPNGKKKTS